MSDGAAIQADRYKVDRGESGCKIVTPFKGGYPIIENPPAPLASSSFPSPPIPGRYMEIAHLRASLILALKKHIFQRTGSKRKAIKEFVKKFNDGSLLPNIHEELGDISVQTLYRFKKKYEESGIDSLIPRYGGAGKSKITDHEKQFLLNFLLHQNKPKISDAIRQCKRYLGNYSTTNSTTLRHYYKNFRKRFYDVDTLEREGEKAWNDKVAPYQDRDPMLLSVGEVLIGDGHKLNLNVLDPLTGKKKRATLVLFWDWKSAYPVGWEVMFSENVQCITTALRNAILCLGKIPSHVYIDNGRAFLAKIFTQSIIIEDTEIPGMFDRLGIERHCSLKYHGQSKPIERFFGVLNDRFEKRMRCYTGRSIEDKPAYLLRNEPRAKALYDEWIPTTDEVSEIMFQWREEYIDEILPSRKGLTARQMFEDGKGTGLDPQALYFLMMAVEVKSIRRNRFTFAGIDWTGPCLYGYKDKILIRYSLSDFSQIYVFDSKNQFMGIVTQAGKADPINDWQAAKKIIKERAAFKRQTKRLADYIEAEEAKKPREKFISAFGDDDDQIHCDLMPKNPDEYAVIVEPDRSPLSRPAGPLFDEYYLQYDWYKKIEKKFPGRFNEADWCRITDYEETFQWEKYYSGDNQECYKEEEIWKDLEHKMSLDLEISKKLWLKNWLENEYKKYLRLMEQKSLTLGDRDFIQNFRKTSPLYKGMRFYDDKELDARVKHERYLRNESQECSEI
jgi:transposase